MIQQLIYDRFGVFYNVFYIAQLLKNLGFSYQKAAFVSDHLDEQQAARVVYHDVAADSASGAKRRRPCCCLAMKPASRSGARSRTRGRGVASNPGQDLRQAQRL